MRRKKDVGPITMESTWLVTKFTITPTESCEVLRVEYCNAWNVKYAVERHYRFHVEMGMVEDTTEKKQFPMSDVHALMTWLQVLLRDVENNKKITRKIENALGKFVWHGGMLYQIFDTLPNSQMTYQCMRDQILNEYAGWMFRMNTQSLQLVESSQRAQS